MAASHVNKFSIGGQVTPSTIFLSDQGVSILPPKFGMQSMKYDSKKFTKADLLFELHGFEKDYDY